MLLRLAYLGITNAFTLLRLLPGSDRDKDAEILALRHQLAVLHRQLDGQRVHFDPADRAWLAALLHQLPDPTCTTCGCWSDPTLCCAGTVTCSPAATRRRRGVDAGAGHVPSVRSEPWYYASCGRTRPGDTGGYMANYSPSASTSPRPRCGRSFETPASIPRRIGPPPPGRSSCSHRPTHCWPRTSSRP